MSQALRLAAKVEATNNVYRTANEFYVKLAAVFAPLVGQKVLTADGNVLAKYAKLMPVLPHGTRLRMWKQTSNYNLSWGISGNAQAGEISMYAEVSLYIGDLNGGVLTKLYPAPEFRTDYTVTEVEGKRSFTRWRSGLLTRHPPTCTRSARTTTD
jgi:hypothetical protein